jgi:hypothetical protein
MNAKFAWWIAISIEAVVLLRGVSAHLVRKYSLFYGYIGCVFVTEVIRLWCYEFFPNLYPAFYWYTELATVVASYAVIIEIFRHALRHNPGACRVTRNLLWTVFAITMTYAALDLLRGGFASLPRAVADLGRYLRSIEGLLLLVMLWLLMRYRISVGRNLLGLILGNSFWVGVNAVNLAFLSSRSNDFSIFFRQVLPVTFIIALMIWCTTLWTAHPDPIQPTENEIERDYKVLAAKTQVILARASNHLLRTMWP